MYSYASNSHPEFRRQLPELIHDVEDFFACGFIEEIFNDDNICGILENLMDKENGFRQIEFLPPELSGCYGNSTKDKIQINSFFAKHRNSPTLTPKEIRRLYMFHEMGHKLLGILKNDDIIEDFAKTLQAVLKEKGLNLKIPENLLIIAGHGFWMLEESLTQELAEILAYKAAGKVRPMMTIRSDMGVNVLTNHDFYGIFQEPTICLGRTLRGCWNGRADDKDVMRKMIKKCLSTNFNLDLISEYNVGGSELYYSLFLTLERMGKLKLLKYQSFGIDEGDFCLPKSTDENIRPYVARLIKDIKSITQKNCDCREYPEKGFPKIIFDKYKKKGTPPDNR